MTSYRGSNGAPAYIAFEGKVYDVLGSFLARRGWHPVRHASGLDYTSWPKETPHGTDVMKRFPVFGILAIGSDGRELDAKPDLRLFSSRLNLLSLYRIPPVRVSFWQDT